MCGRFALQTDLSEIIERFQIQEVACAYQPCDNIYPGQPIAAVIHDRVNRLVAFQWGLIPSWAKDHTRSHNFINARAETVATKPSFKNAFLKRNPGSFTSAREHPAVSPVFTRPGCRRPG